MLRGFHLPLSWTNHLLRAWWWEYSGVIEQEGSQRRFWLCKACHLQPPQPSRSIREPRQTFPTEFGGSNIERHLLEYHRLSKDGPLPAGSKRKRLTSSIIDKLGLDVYDPSDLAVINKLADVYDHKTFRKLLIRWLVYDNVAFNQLESERFNQLLVYLQPRVEESIPCHLSVRRWIMEDYHSLKDRVIEELRTAVSSIHLAFDL